MAPMELMTNSQLFAATHSTSFSSLPSRVPSTDLGPAPEPPEDFQIVLSTAEMQAAEGISDEDGPPVVDTWAPVHANAWQSGRLDDLVLADGAARQYLTKQPWPGRDVDDDATIYSRLSAASSAPERLQLLRDLFHSFRHASEQSAEMAVHLVAYGNEHALWGHGSDSTIRNATDFLRREKLDQLVRFATAYGFNTLRMKGRSVGIIDQHWGVGWFDRDLPAHLRRDVWHSPYDLSTEMLARLSTIAAIVSAREAVQAFARTRDDRRLPAADRQRRNIRAAASPWLTLYDVDQCQASLVPAQQGMTTTQRQLIAHAPTSTPPIRVELRISGRKRKTPPSAQRGERRRRRGAPHVRTLGPGEADDDDGGDDENEPRVGTTEAVDECASNWVGDLVGAMEDVVRTVEQRRGRPCFCPPCRTLGARVWVLIEKELTGLIRRLEHTHPSPVTGSDTNEDDDGIEDPSDLDD